MKTEAEVVTMMEVAMAGVVGKRNVGGDGGGGGSEGKGAAMLEETQALEVDAEVVTEAVVAMVMVSKQKGSQLWPRERGKDSWDV